MNVYRRCHFMFKCWTTRSFNHLYRVMRSRSLVTHFQHYEKKFIWVIDGQELNMNCIMHFAAIAFIILKFLTSIFVLLISFSHFHCVNFSLKSTARSVQFCFIHFYIDPNHIRNCFKLDLLFT